MYGMQPLNFNPSIVAQRKHCSMAAEPLYSLYWLRLLICVLLITTRTTVQGQCLTDSCVCVDATAGETITIPCGDALPGPDVTFIYTVFDHPMTIPTTQHLMINVSADNHTARIDCTSFMNNLPSEPFCYELNVYYAPMPVGEIQEPPGVGGEDYCLSCQVTANPAPTCNWSAFACGDPNQTNVLVYEPFEYRYPASERECPYPQNLSPQCEGCIFQLIRLERIHETLCFSCLAENYLGAHTTNLNQISFNICDGKGTTLELLNVDLTEDLIIPLGGNHNLSCKAANTEESGKLFWDHNDTDYSFEPETCSTLSHFEITDATITDSGNYTCLYVVLGILIRSPTVTVRVVELAPAGGPEDSTSSRTIIEAAAGATAAALVLTAIVVAVLVGVCCVYHGDALRLLTLKEPGYTHTTTDGMQKRFQYDVFLSFAREDESETETRLRQPLKEKGYKVCWHHEDFIPGYPIQENIQNNIYESRKIVLVLSDNFCSSLYCHQELEVSLQKLRETNTRCVVPVLLKDCDTLPHSIKPFTYLDARSSSISDSNFTEKLCKEALGKPLRDVAESVHTTSFSYSCENEVVTCNYSYYSHED